MSCSVSAPKDSAHPAHWLILVASLVLVCAVGCAGGGSPAAALDRHDPEAVLRAYFDAWARGDWPAQTTLMDEKYGRMEPEPLDSIRILDIKLLSNAD